MNRRLPFLSKADRRALLILEWVLILVVLGVAVYGWMQPQPSGRKGASAAADSTSLSHRNTYSRSAPVTYAVTEEPVETFPFDPNTADSTTLLRLGLSPWQVRSIYRYRAKHGRYHSAEDFRRLPGMTGELWERLGPQVRIAERFRYLEPTPKSSTSMPEKPAPVDTTRTASLPTPPRDTLRQVPKYEPGTLVDINMADTTELKRIPGIGSYRARKIVEYRQQLGGFVSAEQVMEACEMPDELLQWVCVSAPSPRRLNVNTLSVQQLMKHPYLSFYQARDLVEYRRKHGPLKSLDELSLLSTFPPEARERLNPYVVFE